MKISHNVLEVLSRVNCGNALIHLYAWVQQDDILGHLYPALSFITSTHQNSDGLVKKALCNRVLELISTV